MYQDCDAELLKYAPDYRINLITPHGLTDEEIDQFQTSLREVTRFLKYSKDKEKLTELINKDERFRHVERRAVDLINAVTKTGIRYAEGEESVDMCQAIREIREDGVMEGIQTGIQKGHRETLLQAIRSLKKNQGLTDEQSFMVLDIPKEDWAEYKNVL